MADLMNTITSLKRNEKETSKYDRLLEDAKKYKEYNDALNEIKMGSKAMNKDELELELTILKLKKEMKEYLQE